MLEGTEILLSNCSVKNIEKLSIDDKVITHKGRERKVINISKVKYNGNVYRLSIKNNRQLIVLPKTLLFNMYVKFDPEDPEYNILSKKYSDPSYTQKIIFRLKHTIKELKFKSIEDLCKYDVLLSPVIIKSVENSISEDEAWLLGIFAAEGSFGKKYNRLQSVIFTFNINEYNTLAKKTKETLEKSFPKGSIHLTELIDKSTCVLTITGKTESGEKITDFFHRHVGEYSDKKILSDDIIFSSSYKVRRKFIIGWLEGDGHVEKTYGRIIGVSVSKDMSNQIRFILHSIGIHNSLYLVDNTDKTIQINPNYKPSKIKNVYRIEIPASSGVDLIYESDFLSFNKKGKTIKLNSYYNNYFIGNVVKNITIENFSGYIYSIIIDEDNSYLANNIICSSGECNENN
jgi:hypothetical protein